MLKNISLPLAIIVSVVCYFYLANQVDSPPRFVTPTSKITTKNVTPASSDEKEKTDFKPAFDSSPQRTELVSNNPTSEELNLDDIEIRDCIATFEQTNSKNDPYNKQALDDYTALLSSSNNWRDKLAFYLFAKQEEKLPAEQFYTALYQQAPTNVIIYSNLLNTCLTNSPSPLCNEALYDYAAQVDKDNGQLDLAKALYLHSTGDAEGTIAALEQSLKKPRFSEYYFEQVDFMLNNMASNSSLSAVEQNLAAMGMAAASGNNIFKVIDLCKQLTPQNNNNAALCLNLGQHIMQNADSSILKMVGISIQNDVYKRRGDQDKVNELTAKSAEHVERIRSDDYQKATFLMMFDIELMQTWLQMALIHGEHDSVDHLIREAKILSANPNYNPCPAQ